MKIIGKFGMPINDFVDVGMPENAKILTVQLQDGEPKIWAVIDTSLPLEARHFRWFGTGHRFLDNEYKQYVVTVQMGCLVFHLFEV